MKPIQEMSQGEIGAYVQSHLRENGIDLVLSGGAVVSIYSSNKYISLDLDKVNIHSVKVSMLRESMMETVFLRTDDISNILTHNIMWNFRQARSQ